MNKILCFGEILLRYSPLPDEESFVQQTIPVYVGGAELNVAMALANWHLPVAYCTAMPDNFLSQSIKKYIRQKNIDISDIHSSGNRIGVYYLAQGNDVKNEAVVFDRVNSSFAAIKPGMINWQEMLKEVRWFHFSAIAASLTLNATAVYKEALETADAMGITISVDLNYRANLWKYGKKPLEVMPELVKYCDVIMGNLWAVESLLDIASPIKNSSGKTNEELKMAAVESMLQIHRQYPKVSTMAYTFRLENNYWAMVQQGNEQCISKHHEIQNVVDKVGSGDCFMAGLIYGLYHQHSLQQIADYAAAAAVGKLYEKGDSTSQTIEQINKNMTNQ